MTVRFHNNKILEEITIGILLFRNFLFVVMVKGEFPTHQPLSHMQKDLRLALGMSEALEHPLPIVATINEIFKRAKRAGYSEHDSSAVYLKSKF